MCQAYTDKWKGYMQPYISAAAQQIAVVRHQDERGGTDVLAEPLEQRSFIQ